MDDAERLSQDPTFRLIGSEKIWESGAALPSRLHWFETEVLSQDGYLRRLKKGNLGLNLSCKDQYRDRVIVTPVDPGLLVESPGVPARLDPSTSLRAGSRDARHSVYAMSGLALSCTASPGT